MGKTPEISNDEIRELPPRKDSALVVEDIEGLEIANPVASDEVDSEIERKREELEKEIESCKKHPIVPAKNRKCRDCFCLLLFVLFWCGMAFIAKIGFEEGEPETLIFGTDYDGTPCGMDENDGKKHMVYPRIQEDFVANLGKSPLDYKFFGICNDGCPKAGDIICTKEVDAKGWDMETKFPDCTNESHADYNTADCTQIRTNCWKQYLKGENLLWRCLPLYQVDSEVERVCAEPEGISWDDPACKLMKKTSTTETLRPPQSNYLFDTINTADSLFGHYIGDLINTWGVIVFNGLILALIVGFVYILLVRRFSGFMVWTTIWCCQLMLIGLTVFCYVKAGIIEVQDYDEEYSEAIEEGGELEMLPNVLHTSENADMFKYCAYGLTACSLLLFVLILALRNKIRMAIIIIKEAAECLQRIPMLVLYPITTVFFIACLYVYFVVTSLFIFSAGEITLQDMKGTIDEVYANPELNQNLPPEDEMITSFNSYERNDINKYMLMYNFFGLLWTTQLIQAIGLTTIAGAVYSFYWNRDSIPRVPVIASLYRALRYHLGSLCFGSLLIAIIQFVRAVLTYIEKKTRGGDGQPLALKSAFKIIRCCLWCLEKVLKFINKNAYIVIAIDGSSFCGAVKEAMSLIMSNIVQMALVNALSETIMFLGKIFITCACGLGAYFVIKQDAEYEDGGEYEVSSTWLPVLVTMFLAYFVACGFFYVYDMTVDTILLCYCKDRKLNFDRCGKLASCSKRMQKFMTDHQGGKKKRKKIEDKEEKEAEKKREQFEINVVDVADKV
eukprot:TRINITY_DN5644_c0_g1_i1.p1 TRINITY_DN5644_c0_g1~~TRINITY_DN5644_c0_g1_i1.p1  ORF type:complete len:786 (-),score=258.57 TRINITY_DN5644_c0_g1_i1:291-2648(-)